MKHLICVLACGVSYVACAAEPTNPALGKELLVRVMNDQHARHAFIAFMSEHGSKANGVVVPADLADEDAAEFKSITEEMANVDAENTNWMKPVVTKHGWPTETLVGKDGAKAAWLLVQHADADREFQRRCLRLMTELPFGEVPRRDVAYLTDRLLVANGKKQTYGTQCVFQNGKVVPKPIEDAENVDQRRAKVGLPSLNEYLRVAQEQYTDSRKTN